MSEAAEAPLDRESLTDLEFQVGKGEEWNENSSQALYFQYKVLERWEHRGGVCANERQISNTLRVRGCAAVRFLQVNVNLSSFSFLKIKSISSH